MAGRVLAVALVLAVGSTGVARAQPYPSGPLGKWVRKSDHSQVVLDVEVGRLHLHVSTPGEKTLVLHADYAVTRDCTLYGVVTSVESDEDADELDRDLVDQPFSCRFRVDEGGLMVRDLRFAPFDRRDSTWNGHFRAVVPSPSASSGGQLLPPPVIGDTGTCEPAADAQDGASQPIPVTVPPLGPLVPVEFREAKSEARSLLRPPPYLNTTFYLDPFAPPPYNGMNGWMVQSY